MKEEGRNQKAEIRRQQYTDATYGTDRDRNSRQVPGWWIEVPDAEKAVIRDVLTAIRGLKASRSAPVGLAARKWERSIACFIKFRLMGGASRWQRHGPKAEMQANAISSQSTSHSQPSASPVPG